MLTLTASVRQFFHLPYFAGTWLDPPERSRTCTFVPAPRDRNSENRLSDARSTGRADV